MIMSNQKTVKPVKRYEASASVCFANCGTFFHDIRLENLKPVKRYEASASDCFANCFSGTFFHDIRLENLKPVKCYEADGEGGGKGKDHREGGGQPEHFVIWDHDIDYDNNRDDFCDIDFDDDGNIFKSQK